MTEMHCRWRPPSQLQNHTGGLISSDIIFFAPPPVEIGQLLSAQCGVFRVGSAVAKPIPQKIIGLFVLFGVVVGGFLGAGFSHLSLPGVAVGALIGALLIGGPIYRRELKRNDCTYVGTHGIARYPFSSLHFARAAEEAWTQFILPRVEEDLKRTGTYRFQTRQGLTSKQYVVVGPGYLDFNTDGKTRRNVAGDLDDIVLHQGWIIIRRKDAQNRAMNSLDGSHGIFYLSYGSVSNVKLFLTLLTQVVGVTVRS